MFLIKMAIKWRLAIGREVLLKPPFPGGKTPLTFQATETFYSSAREFIERILSALPLPGWITTKVSKFVQKMAPKQRFSRGALTTKGRAESQYVESLL